MQAKRIIKSILARTPVYNGWVALQQIGQRQQFNRLLRDVAQTQGETPSLAKELAALALRRRALSSRPRVVALGHNAWEQYGLWPTFSSLADFHLIPLDLVDGTWNESLRSREGARVLAAIDALDRESPVELVFIYADSSFLDPAMLKGLAERNIWTVLMGLDDKHRLATRMQFGMQTGQALIAPLVDIYWTTWKSAIPLFWKIGARPLYLAEGADPNFHHPIELERDIEVLFLGAKYGTREKMVSYLRKQGYGVEAYGRGWPNEYVSFEKSIELISRSKVVLGIGGVGHLDTVQHLKGRDFEVPMCGAVYLTSYNPELADWYAIGEEILCYSSPQNCVEILDWTLRDTQKQTKIRSAALLRSLRDHTWESRLNTLFDVLTAEPSNE